MNSITSPKFTLVLYITIDNDILMVLNQIVSIVVYANYKHINWAVILPEKQKTILNDFCYHEFNYKSIQDISSKKYFYSPDINQLSVINSIDILQKYNEYDYIIMGDTLPEFKHNDMSMMEYISAKNDVVRQIHVSTHDYVLSQINTINDLDMEVISLYINNHNIQDVKNMIIKATSKNNNTQTTHHYKYIILYNKETINREEVDNIFSTIGINHTIIDMNNNETNNFTLILMTVLMLSSVIIGELNIMTYYAMFNDCKMFIYTDVLSGFTPQLVDSVKLYDIPQNIFFPNMKSMIKYV